MFLEITARSEVQLTALGPYNNQSFVTLCPNQNYTIVFECVVIKGSFLFWLLGPLLGSQSRFGATDVPSEVDLTPVTLILSDRVIISSTETNYKSQLHVPTESLRGVIIDHGYPLNVTCRDIDDVEKTIFIRFSGIF